MSSSETYINPTAFDALAASYDAEFTATRLGQLLRARVWAVLAAVLPAGCHILELTCGTGEDAVWLAQQGHTVVATDGSPEMVQVAQTKVAQAGLQSNVQVRQMSLQDFFTAETQRARRGRGVF